MTAKLLLGSEWIGFEVSADADTILVRETGADSDTYLVPGLVDIHCHGYDGLDVMDGRAEEIGRRLRAIGVEFFCPTTVSAPWNEIRAALSPIRNGFEGFAGVHLEGPMLNPLKAGAQPKTPLRDFTFDELKTELGDSFDLLRIVTLAPERGSAIEFIANAAAANLRVSAGHTDASFETLRRAKDAGLAQMTHFYNAMRPFSHREPGCVGFGLTQEIDCEIIYDGHHVSREAFEILWRCRGPRQVLAISDGTKFSGASDDRPGEMWGLRVRKRDGCVRLEDGTLAGSCATQLDVFVNLWRDFGPSVATAACSTNPRRALSLGEPGLWLEICRGKLVNIHEGKLAHAD